MSLDFVLLVITRLVMDPGAKKKKFPGRRNNKNYFLLPILLNINNTHAFSDLRQGPAHFYDRRVYFVGFTARKTRLYGAPE